MMGWAWQVGKEFAAEFGIVGFGGSGLTVTGSGNVSVLSTSYALLMAGVPRAFMPAPDLIVLNEGTNDGSQAAALQAAVSPLSPSRITWIDTTGFFNTSYGADSLNLHPSGRSTRQNLTGLSRVLNRAGAISRRAKLDHRAT